MAAPYKGEEAIVMFDDLAKSLAIEGAVSAHQDVVEVIRRPREHVIYGVFGAISGAHVTGAVNHGEAFARGCHRDDLRLVRPLPVVGKVGALLLHAAHLLDVAVDVEDAQLALATPALSPRELAPNLLLQLIVCSSKPSKRIRMHGALEAAKEVTGCRWIGQPTRPHHPPYGFVALQVHHVFDAGAADVEIHGVREHVIGLVIRQVHLEHLDVLVDERGHVEPPAELLEEREPAKARDGGALLGLDVQLRHPHQWPRALGPRQLVVGDGGAKVDVTGAWSGLFMEGRFSKGLEVLR